MAEEKAPRPIAGDVGTDNRIDCEAGHYWVRLWSKQAIRREGDAMMNCLRGGGFDNCAGSDDPKQDGLWSLRDSKGRSIALARTVKITIGHLVKTFLGVSNSTASKLAYRQLRHLNAAFQSFGSGLRYDGVHLDPVVVAPDGATYRWDRAPSELRLPDHYARLEARRQAHEDAKRRREAAERVRANQPPIPAGEPDAVGIDFQIGYYGEGPGLVAPPREGEPVTVTEWCSRNLRLTDVQHVRVVDGSAIATLSRIVEGLPQTHRDALADATGRFQMHVSESAAGGFAIRINRRVFHVSDRYVERAGFEGAVRTTLNREALIPEFVEIRTSEAPGNTVVARARDITWLPPSTERDEMVAAIGNGVVSRYVFEEEFSQESYRTRDGRTVFGPVRQRMRRL